jgi:uncharacterized integral membrane protein
VVGYLIVAVLASAVAVFALQNGAPTPVRFFVWNLDGVPLAGLILGAFAAGVIIAAIPLVIQRWRARARARALETRVRELETSVAERDKPRPSPPAASRPAEPC